MRKFLFWNSCLLLLIFSISCGNKKVTPAGTSSAASSASSGNVQMQDSAKSINATTQMSDSTLKDKRGRRKDRHAVTHGTPDQEKIDSIKKLQKPLEFLS